MAGERSLVNIMSDVDIGGSTIKNEWKKALAEGLIPKTERISYEGMSKASVMRAQGQPVKRISGKPFVDQTIEIPPEHKGKTGKTGEKSEIPEKTGGKEGPQDLSAISEQISTSMNSMRKELKNELGTINTRLKSVEQARPVNNKGSTSPPSTKTGTIDLRQGAQEPPPETVDITADDGDENEGDDDDENKEPPEGQSRVIVPDGTPDGKVVFLPTPYAQQLAQQKKGLILLKQNVRPAGVGINPYEKKIVPRRTCRRVIEITPKREIRS